jgi:hypothetical protein
MKPGNWIVAVFMLSLLAVAGVAIDASAQTPATPDTKPSAPESAPAQPAPSTQGEDKGSPAAPPPAARTDQPQQPAPGSTVIDRQVETRTVEREPARFLGVDPVIALIVGAVVLVVIILGMVAMSRREEDHPHRHTV